MSVLDKPAMPNTVRIVDERFSDLRGMTLRQHAAISLRVPMSGDDELDAMIREARRLDSTTYYEERGRKILDDFYKKTGIYAQKPNTECTFNPMYTGPSNCNKGTVSCTNPEHRKHPDAEGWIEWNGGECPVDDWEIVQIKTRDSLNIWNMHEGSATHFRWKWICSEDDIIAYRVVRGAAK